MNELEEAVKLFGREDLLNEYGIQDTDTNIEVFLSVKDMIKYYKQDKEIERLTFESTKWESKFYDEAKKVDKAIEYIEHEVGNEIHDMMYVIDVSEVLDILKGSDKE